MLRKLQMALAALLGVTIVAVLAVSPQSVRHGSTDGNAGSALVAPKVQTERSHEKTATRVTFANSKARNVGTGTIASPEMGDQALERIEALPQPTSHGASKPAERTKPKYPMRWKLIYNSVITSAGVFDINGTTLVLPGIDIVPANATCTAPNSINWPCGMAARTAFRNYVQGRAITCKVPDMPPQNSFTADCMMAGQDMAAWLVEHGWAKAKLATPYVDLEAKAKSQRLGIFGDPPRGVEAASKAGPVLALP